MGDAAPPRRRHTTMLAVSVVFLVGSVALSFRVGDGLTRWLVVLAWLSLTMVSWRLRRGASTLPASRRRRIFAAGDAHRRPTP